MKPLTPNEYLAMGISARMDALEAKLDELTRHVTIDIKLDLMEVDILLEGIEACDRKYPRVNPQQGDTNQ